MSDKLFRISTPTIKYIIDDEFDMSRVASSRFIICNMGNKNRIVKENPTIEGMAFRTDLTQEETKKLNAGVISAQIHILLNNHKVIWTDIAKTTMNGVLGEDMFDVPDYSADTGEYEIDFHGTVSDYDVPLHGHLDVTLEGSVVIPNPEGEATDDLTKVEIDGEIFLVKDSTIHDWARAEEKPTYTKAEVGLGNVDNTSDLEKPVSTATQAALDLKANSSSVYTKTESDNLLSGKVDKVQGKGLSTNDYTNEAKAIVDGVTSALNGKADKSDTYTKSEVDSALENKVDSLITGIPTGLYNFEKFKKDVPTWANYDVTKVSVSNTAVTLNDSGQSFIYKRDFFQYYANSDITVSIKVRVDGYDGGTYGQQVRIVASGYSSSNITKEISVNKEGTAVTYDGVTYNIGDVIDVVISLTNVPINDKAYISFNNRNNPNMPPVEVSIVDYYIYYSNYSIVAVKYAENLIGGHLKGKKWAAVGDSLTATYFDLYVSYVATNLGMDATNYGVGSSKVTQVDGSTDSFVERICGLNGNTPIPDEYDLWTIFGGINDSFGNVTIGTISDSTPTTFYGALNTICQYLLNLNSHPTIAFITPYNAKNTAEEGYVTAIVNIAHKYGLPVLNLYEVSGIGSQNWTYYIRDSVHPTQAGANKLRPIILEWFERLRCSETTPTMPN